MATDLPLTRKNSAIPRPPHTCEGWRKKKKKKKHLETNTEPFSSLFRSTYTVCPSLEYIHKYPVNNSSCDADNPGLNRHLMRKCDGRISRSRRNQLGKYAVSCAERENVQQAVHVVPGFAAPHHRVVLGLCNAKIQTAALLLPCASLSLPPPPSLSLPLCFSPSPPLSVDY